MSDIVVIDARVAGGAGPLAAIADDAFVAAVESGLSAPFRTARAAFARLRAAGGGDIVIVTSSTALRGSHTEPAESVAAAGAVMLAEMLAAEGAHHGIRCNALCVDRAVASTDDVAAAVAWLGSDAARHVSGATLRIDGARSAAMIMS